MYEDHVQSLVAQMPHISRPHPFDVASIYQLIDDGLNAVTHPPQHRAPTVGRRMFGGAKRRKQHHDSLAQMRFEIGQPILAVVQQQTRRASRQFVIGRFAFMQIGWSQVDLRDDSRPGHLSMEAKAIKRLSDRMIEA